MALPTDPEDPEAQPDPTGEEGVTKPAAPPGTPAGHPPAQPDPGAAPPGSPASEGVEDPSIPPGDEPTDPRGVPFSNFQREVDRKLSEGLDGIRRLVEERLPPTNPQYGQPGAGSGGQPPSTGAPGQSDNPLGKYTTEQLAYIAQNQPEWGPAVAAERDRRIIEQTTRAARDTAQAETKARDMAAQHSASMQMIASKYPFVLTPDRRQFNGNHQLVQLATQIYGSSPLFKQDGSGWLAAFDMAYGRLAYAKELQTRGRSVREAKGKLPAPSGGNGGGAPPPASPAPTEQQTTEKLFAERRKHRSGTPEYNRLTTEIYKVRGLIGAAPSEE